MKRPMATEDRRVLISGGGPVGLLCAWLLGRKGIPVRLFDENDSPQADPRAATTHPATLDLLSDDGLADDMARVGLVAPIFQFWDRPTDSLVAEFDHAILKNDTQASVRGAMRAVQDREAPAGARREACKRRAHVRPCRDRRRAGREFRERRPCAARTASRPTRAPIVIGADGGRSTVRKQSGIAFDGFTWPERFIVFTTPFDFEANRGYCYRSYFADPGAWCNCFKVSADGPPGLWRTVYPTDSTTPEEELTSDAAVQALMQKFFPAPHDYEVVHRNLYVTHQRVAATFRKGRVVLAGDSAHVNNPIGGMGLNGGLQDGANLSDKLARILLDGAPERLLDVYDRQRRTVAVEFVQEQSIANKKRLEASDPEVRKRNLDDLRAIAADPERARQFLLRTAMIASQRRADALELEDA